MKRFTLSLTLVVCFLAVLPARAPALGKDNWIRVRSKNFLLVGNASEKQIRQVGMRLEQFREVFSRLFPNTHFKTPVPTTVVVFKNDSSYRPFKPNANTAGYFQSGPDVNYITLTSEMSGEHPFSVIFHEYTHLLVNNSLGNVPPWFGEGMAECYSTVSITNDRKVVLGQPIASHVLFLRRKKMLPLKQLFQVDHKSPYYNESDKQSVFYAQSWALMHYLIFADQGKRASQLNTLLKLIAANVPMDQAFQQTFSMTLESMERRLEGYIQNVHYPIITGEFSSKLESSVEMQAAPLSEAEALAYLGDLLLHSNRAEAEGYLQKALALDPNLAMAHASLGLLRVREGKAEEARKSLERAVAANSQNYLIHYYYAFALSREGQDSSGMVQSFAQESVTKMRAELKKAIELRPDFPASYSLLAFVNLVTHTQLDESIEMLKHALTIARGGNDLVYMLAQVYMGKEDFKTARELLEKVAGESNADAELRGRAQSLLDQMKLIEEQSARVQSPIQPTSQSSGDTEEEVPVEEVDPSSYLRNALRKPQAGETQVQGTLVRVDCDAKGMTFVVKVGAQVLRLKGHGFGDVDLTSFTADAGREISCGPRKPESNVVVGYVATNEAKARVDGVAKSVEFVPKDFVLKP